MKRKLMLVGAVLSAAAFTSAAHAGATISDKRYWPNEAHQSPKMETGRADVNAQNPLAPPLRGKARQNKDKANMRRNAS